MRSSLLSDRLEEFELRRTHGVEFWNDKSGWPIDTSEYVFLGRAVHSIGLNSFPHSWTAMEPAERFLPDFDEPEMGGQLTYDLNSGWGRDYLASILDQYAPDDERDLPLTHSQIIQGLDIYAENVAPLRKESAARLELVVKKMLRALADGQIIAYSQLIGGATPFEEVPAIRWTDDDARQWFNFCYIETYGQSPASLKEQMNREELPPFIFILRETLETFLSSSDSVWSERASILEAVKYNELTPEEADYLARAAGAVPFSFTPDPAEFNPLAEEKWTFEMVAAWVIWRDVDKVRDLWPSYQKKIVYWSKTFATSRRDGSRGWSEGHELSQGEVRASGLKFGPMSEGTYRANGKVAGPRALEDYKGAEAGILKRLTSGELVAEARISSSPNWFDLRPDEWKGIQIICPEMLSGLVRFVAKESGIEFLDLRLPSKLLTSLWPPREAGQIAATNSPSTTATRKGRPEKYDWPSFEKEVLLKLDEEGDFDLKVDTNWNQAALERHMAEWCNTEWRGKSQPAESTIRARVSSIRQAFIKARNEGQ